MAYTLEGRLLEVCNCKIACPCWLGEDPDPGFCWSVEGYHFDRGTVNGVDVSGLTVGVLSDIPGNILAGNHRIALFIDDRASDEQADALTRLWTGKLGGPVAEVCSLWGEIVAIERAAITFDVDQGEGHLQIGSDIEARLAPYRGPDGDPPPGITRRSPRCPATPPTSPRLRCTARRTPSSASAWPSKATTPSRATSASRRTRGTA